MFNQKYVIIMKFEKNLKIRVAQSRLVFVTVCVLSAVTAIPLVAILGEVLLKGWHQLDWTFLTQSTPDPVKAMLAADAGQPVPGGIATARVSLQWL